MIEMRYQDKVFKGKVLEFPEEEVRLRVTKYRSMSGARRTLVQTPSQTVFSVRVTMLTRESFEELRQFVIDTQGQKIQVFLLESQRANNLGVPISEDYGTPRQISKIMYLVTVPVVFADKTRYATDVVLDFEEAV